MRKARVPNDSATSPERRRQKRFEAHGRKYYSRPDAFHSNLEDYFSSNAKERLAAMNVTFLPEPGEAAWKRLLDSLILYDKKGERLNYPEGRSIILQNLSTREKANVISKLPEKATYIKSCFRQFWKLKLAPKTDTTAGIGTESPWHGHRVQISVTNQQRHYCKHVLQITQFSDCMDRDTNRPFSRFEWKRIVKRMHRK